MCSSCYCCDCCVRLFQVLIVLLNTCLLLGGLLVAGVGGVLVALSQGSLTPVVQGIISNMVDLGRLSPSGENTQDVGAQKDFTQLLQPTGIALVVIGGTIVGIALCGYCGGNFTVLMKIYAVMLVIIVVAEVILVALFFSGTFNPYMKEAANRTLTNHYNDLTDKGIFSMIWNLIMIKSECCGLTGYTDFFYAIHSWPRNETIRFPDKSQSLTGAFLTPLACCRTTGQFPEVQFIDDHCAITPSSNNSNYLTGCWDKVSQDLNPLRTGIILGFSAAIAIKAGLALMALFVAKNSSKISPI